MLQETAQLFDERGRTTFRDHFKRLTRESTDIATAVTRVRLTTLELEESDYARVEHHRVLVAEINALTLDAEARLIRADPRRSPRVSLYRELLESGRLEVRAAPLAGWSPDFTVFSDHEGPSAVLVGYHWLEHPFPLRGPALGSMHGREAARRAASRHREVWDRAHDVGPALWSILAKASNSRSWSLPLQSSGRPDHPTPAG